MYENPEALFGGETRLLDLISLIYSAVDRPSLWPTVLDGIAEAANSRCTLLFAEYDPYACNVSAHARGDTEYIDSYKTYYGSVNVLAAPCDRIFPTGSVRYSHVAVPEAEFEKTEFYADWFRPQDYLYSYGIKVPLQGMKPAYMTTLRSRRYGPYDERDGMVLTTLLPHLQRALRLYIQFSMLQSGLAATLDHLPYGLALLNSKGQCILVNKLAQAILDRRDGLRLVKSQLIADSFLESPRLRAMIKHATSLGLSSVAFPDGALLISRRNGSPLQVIVSPFVTGLVNVPSQVVATVIIRDPDTKGRAPVEVLQSLYGLTKAEAMLAALLVEGRDLTEAAATLQVTKETVRSQLKQVFQKTGTQRQAELVRLLVPVVNWSTDHQRDVKGPPPLI